MKSNLYIKEIEEGDENYMIEFNVIYFDVYQLPTLYFIIYKVEEGNRLISFDEFLTNMKRSRNYTNDFVSKNYEISKTV